MKLEEAEGASLVSGGRGIRGNALIPPSPESSGSSSVGSAVFTVAFLATAGTTGSSAEPKCGD
jgi:hypothetical protein